MAADLTAGVIVGHEGAYAEIPERITLDILKTADLAHPDYAGWQVLYLNNLLRPKG